MTKKIIATSDAPQAIGPYSQAVQTGDLLFVSGQIPLIPSTGELLDGDIQAQTKQVLENLQAILKTAGCTSKDLIRTTIFLKDMNDFGAVNEIYGSWVAEPFPARACVEVSRLPKDVRVEIDAIAKVPS